MDWSLFFSGLSASATLLILIQLILAYISKRKEHEEQRRQKTVDVLLEWNKSLERETSFAERIVETFDTEQCRKLFQKEPFKVNEETHKELCEICCNKNVSDCNSCTKDERGDYTVSGRQLLELRWYIISYLNTLETVLIAWQQSAVDRKMIEREFAYLYSAEKGWDVLSAFRTAAGGMKAYPVIDQFILQLKTNEEKKDKILLKYNL